MRKINLIIFVALISFCEGIDVYCMYDAKTPYGYRCTGINSPFITSKEESEVTSVAGPHLPGKTNDDVKFFEVQDQDTIYFPSGLTKYFKNIESIQLASTKLKELTKEDLKEFGGKLKNLWLYDNDITVIQADLFQYNPNLEFINLGDNKVAQVELGAFNGLDKLHTLWLFSNPCRNGIYDDKNRTQLLMQIKEIEANCKNAPTA